MKDRSVTSAYVESMSVRHWASGAALLVAGLLPPANKTCREAGVGGP